MGKKKILLFNPNPRGYKGEEDIYCILPMSLLAISAFLIENYEVKIVDQTVDSNYIQLIEEHLQDAFCLGITSMTGHQIKGGIDIAKIVKEKRSDIPIVWGGYHASIFPEETIKSNYVDFVVRNQGEITFLELLLELENKKNFKRIKGITYIENGEVISTAVRQNEKINKFPSMPYHLVDVNKYIVDSVGKRTLGIRTSQGCPNRCGFCAEVNVTQRRWSGYSAEQVLKDMKYLIDNYHVDCFMLYDPNFMVDKKRVKDILSGIIKNKWNIKLSNLNGRTEQLVTFDDEMWELFKKAGCNDILIGAEAGSDEMLSYITKDTNLENTIKVKKIFAKYGIQPFVSLILGFPRSENMQKTIKEEFGDLLNLIDEINKISYRNHIRIWLYMPYAGTPLYEKAIADSGLVMPKKLEDWAACNLTENNVPWIPKKYRMIVNQLNNYIFPYTAEQFNYNWKKRKKGFISFLKYIAHNSLHQTALFRLNNRFFSLPIEHKILSFVKRKKYKK